MEGEINMERSSFLWNTFNSEMAADLAIELINTYELINTWSSDTATWLALYFMLSSPFYLMYVLACTITDN